MRNNKCVFCGKKKYKKKMYVSHSYYYSICLYCGGGMLQPQPTDQDLQQLYKTIDYFEGLSAGVNNPIFQKILTSRIYDTSCDWVDKNFEIGKILDVGCGNGEFLQELKKKYWDTYGTDISNLAAKNTENKIGKKKVKKRLKKR